MMDRFFASRTTRDKVADKPRISARTSTRIKELVEDGKLKGVVLENTQTGETDTIEVDGIFVFIGQEPNTTLFADTVSLDEASYILADENMQTNLKGVFSARDVNRK